MNQKGGALGIAMALTGVCMVMGVVLSQGLIQRKKSLRQSIDRLALDVATRNAFTVLEKALQRRLWEAPLEADCTSATTFSMDLSLRGGIKVKVEALVDSERKAMILTATGQENDLHSVYRKIIKMSEVGDFLILSKGTEETVVGRHGSSNTNIAGYIAGPKKIHLEGPLIMESLIHRTNYSKNYTPNQVMDKPELGTIFQGDRMTFAGGVRYMDWPNRLPNDSSAAEKNMVLQARAKAGASMRYSSGPGSAVFTSDIAVASTLASAISTPNLSLMQPVSFYQNITYPYALFCGSTPLYAGEATDTGCFTNDPKRNYVINFSWGGANNYGGRAALNCVMDPDGKKCSHSLDFPKGFQAWKKQANLDSTLFTDDTTPIKVPPINWDNMEALREEAQLCGVVIDSPRNSYEDCDLANQIFLKNYLKSGGSTTCPQISRLSTASLTGAMGSWDPGAYKGVNSSSARKIIYSRVPLEISQSQESGLWPELTDPEVRGKMPLWFVSESYFRLKPYQKDRTSPMDSDPRRMRDLHFNGGFGGSSDLRPLNLVFLAPEKTEVVSPFHIPTTQAQMLGMFPVVGGRIKPKAHLFTDHIHQENDGFKYGLRNIALKNTAFIGAYTHPINLRGLWGVWGWLADQRLSSMCLYDKPGDNLGTSPYAGGPIPAYASDPSSNVPPPSSYFYDNSSGSRRVPQYRLPYVFLMQKNLGLMSSSVQLGGHILNVGFADEERGGINLSQVRRESTAPNSLTFLDHFGGDDVDLSGRNYTWDLNLWTPKKAGPKGGDCQYGSVLRMDGSRYIMAAYTNVGQHTLVQVPPEGDFVNLGAIFGEPLIVVHERSR